VQEWPQNMTRKKKYEIIRCAYIFIILEVNVPVKFSGTGGFPVRRDGR
jgi:hypothetical protein